LIEHCTQSDSNVILLFIVLEEEIAYCMGFGAPKFLIDHRFGQDRFTTSRVG